MNTKNKKENGKEKDLFNTLADSVGCDYVSDLRYEPFNSSAKRLIARIHKDNQASQALALKAGFIKGDTLSSEHQMDLYTYELIRSNDG